MGYIGNQPAEKFSSFSKQTFSPDGSSTSFTLDYAVSGENELALFVNNVRQEPGSGKAYTASGTTLTMSEAPGSSDTMYGIFIGKAVQTVTPATGSVTNAMLSGSIESSKLAFASYPYRNLIINGDMSLAQRSTSESSVSTGYNTIDRFAIIQSNSSANWNESQSTDVPTGQGFSNSWKLLAATGGAVASNQRTVIRQRFEGQMLQYLKKGTANAESVTSSFWVKSSTTGTYICELRDVDNSRSISKSYTINSANTWEKKTLTFAGDTTGTFGNDNNASLDIWWWLDAGTNYSSGTLQTSWGAQTDTNSAVGQTNLGATTNNDFYITGVQLEVGTSASDFEFLPFDVNLQRCLRYYEKSYRYDEYAGASTNDGVTRFSGTTDGSSNMVWIERFQVQKRASPTMTYYMTNGTNNAWAYFRSGANGQQAPNNWNHNQNQASHYITFGSAHNFGAGYIEGHWVADAEL